MGNTPKATHSGTWEINENIQIECYVMDTKERVLSLRGAAKSMGLTGGGSMALVRNLNAKWISPYLSDDLRDWLMKASRNDLPYYLTKRGGKFTPFSADMFVDLCKAYVDARQDGVLKLDSQIAVADKLYAIMTAFAKTGLSAIIDEVLPSIRKNGGYITGQEYMTPEQIVANALVIANNIIAERDRIIAKQKEKIEEQQPLVDFAVHVSQTKDTIDMDEMSKIARDENIDIGRNRLVKWLKEKKILKDNRTPYQTFIDRGYFDVVEVKKETTYGTRVFPKTVITGKGQMWVIERLRQEYCK